MNPNTIDDDENEYISFATPSLTPHVSDRSTSEYFDLECSFTHKEHLHRMSIVTRNLAEAVDICSQLDDNESESDVHDQQPTEATDDGIDDPLQTHTVTVPNIDVSLHSQSADESHDDDDTLSCIQETVPVEESSSSIVMSDTETFQIEKRHERQVLNYSRSLCVPYTNEQEEEEEEDEISIMKETLTTTTDLSTISIDFTEVVKKDKNNLGHIMISYNHTTKAVCSKIAKSLKNRNYIVWIDQDNISGDILTSMAQAIEDSFVVLMAINEQYYQSRYCRLEAEYAVEQNKAYIPMIMQTGYRPLGWLGIINGAKLHIDFSQLPFDEAFNLLIREIEAVRISFGADPNNRTVAIPVNNQMTTTITTTMNNTWSDLQNIYDWNSDDVIEWLNREKLDVFEEGLRYFTGSTLWQLYKIKFDSPPDYYRMVETILPPTIPLRLVYNLRFYAALESLFSSCIPIIHR